MKSHPFGDMTQFMTACSNTMNYAEYFRMQDRGTYFVKCDVISLASITKIKVAAHSLKMVSFWPVLRSSFSETILHINLCGWTFKGKLPVERSFALEITSLQKPVTACLRDVIQ